MLFFWLFEGRIIWCAPLLDFTEYDVSLLLLMFEGYLSIFPGWLAFPILTNGGFFLLELILALLLGDPGSLMTSLVILTSKFLLIWDHNLFMTLCFLLIWIFKATDFLFHFISDSEFSFVFKSRCFGTTAKNIINQWLTSNRWFRHLFG